MKRDSGTKLSEGIVRIEQHLFSLEKKIDTLISRSSHPPIPPERPQHQGQAPQHARPQNQNAQRFHHQHNGARRNNFRQRELFRAVCADCGKACEVPFKPSAGRPVYCKECFARRRSGGGPHTEKRPMERPLSEKRDERPREEKFYQKFVSGKKRGKAGGRQGGRAGKKYYNKKKASSGRRKK